MLMSPIRIHQSCGSSSSDERRSQAPTGVMCTSAPARTSRGESGIPRPEVKLPTGVSLAKDAQGQWVVLFPSAWSARYFGELNPGVELRNEAR